MSAVGMENLAVANHIRSMRAELKRQIKAGEVRPEGILEDPPTYAEGMMLWDLLRAQPRWGSERIRTFLRELSYRHLVFKVGEFRSIGSLTVRERSILSDELEGS